MKRLLIFVAVWAAAVCRAQSPADTVVDSLLGNNCWFALDMMLQDESASLSPLVHQRAKAYADARFRRYDASNETISALFADPDTPPQWQEGLVYLMMSNFRHAQQYEALTDFYGSLLAQNGIEPESDSGYRYYNSLAGQPCSYMKRPDRTVEVPFKVDSVGRGELIYVDVGIGGRTEPFILDTGCAEFSLVSAEFAEAHGIRPVGDMRIRMNGVAGSEEAWIGIADSLCVGPMTLYNPLFTVCPKERLLPEGAPIEIDAVLGCNFMHSAGTVEFLGHERKLRFPWGDDALPAPPNMMEDGGLAYVQVTVDDHPAVMLLDSGNVKSDFTSVYMSKYGERCKSFVEETETRRGGVGGILEGRAYVIPAVSIDLENESATLYDVDVVDFKLNHESGEDGSLGVDFLLSCSRVRIDYDRMRLTFESRSRGGVIRNGTEVSVSAPDYTPEREMLWQSRNRRAGIGMHVNSPLGK